MKEFHPVANLFPMMDDDALSALTDDIKKNGLIEPIWLHEDGRIIDGRNRYKACIAAGVKPAFRTWRGDGSLISFVLSLNLERRHLTSGQRAALSVEVLPMLEEEARQRQKKAAHAGAQFGRLGGRGNKKPLREKIPEGVFDEKKPAPRPRDIAAEMTGTNNRYVQDAKALKDELPEVFEDVKAGKTSMGTARRKLGKHRAAKRRRKRAEKKQRNNSAPTEQRVFLHVGDAANLSMLSAESVDVIITSPPYNLGADAWPMGGNSRAKRDRGIGYSDQMSGGDYVAWQLRVFDELFRVAKPGASFFYNHKPRTLNGRLIHPFEWVSRAGGWTVRQEIIWDREVTHNHSKTLFWPIDERIYWLTKGKPSIYSDAIGMPTVWRFHGPAPHTWHPAPFSVELPTRCLQAIGGSGLHVLDPFAGSCTTIKAAIDAGHVGIGVDVNQEYLTQARGYYGW